MKCCYLMCLVVQVVKRQRVRYCIRQAFLVVRKRKIQKIENYIKRESLWGDLGVCYGIRERFEQLRFGKEWGVGQFCVSFGFRGVEISRNIVGGVLVFWMVMVVGMIFFRLQIFFKVFNFINLNEIRFRESVGEVVWLFWKGFLFLEL